MRRLLAEITSAELTEYMAYERLEPFGEARADLRAGIVASTVANHGMSPPRRPMRPLDFMPLVREPDAPIRPADPDQHAALLAKTLFGDNVKGKTR